MNKDDLILMHLQDLKESQEKLHDKLDQVAGKVEKHEGSISTMKWGLGITFSALIAMIGAFFKSH